MIGGFDHLNRPRVVAIDESLIIHNEKGEQIWLLGGIETKERRVRLLFTKNRSAAIIEKFVYENFLERTHFVHDAWPAYTNIFDNNINYTHETYVHQASHFGIGSHSTADIENYWAQLKKLIIRIYGIIPKKNYTLLVKEMEFRINISTKNIDEQKEILKNIFKNILEYNNYEMEKIEDL